MGDVEKGEDGIYAESNMETKGWIKKVWYIYTVEYYSAIKRMK